MPKMTDFYIVVEHDFDAVYDRRVFTDVEEAKGVARKIAMQSDHGKPVGVYQFIAAFRKEVSVAEVSGDPFLCADREQIVDVVA